MKVSLNRPVKPERFESRSVPSPSFALLKLGRELIQESSVTKPGRTAVTLVDHPQMKVVLAALPAGCTLPEHHVTRPVTVTVVSGKLLFRANGEETELPSLCAIALAPGAPHSATAKEDAAFLIVMGGES